MNHHGNRHMIHDMYIAFVHFLFFPLSHFFLLQTAFCLWDKHKSAGSKKELLLSVRHTGEKERHSL